MHQKGDGNNCQIWFTEGFKVETTRTSLYENNLDICFSLQIMLTFKTWAECV